MAGTAPSFMEGRTGHFIGDNPFNHIRDKFIFDLSGDLDPFMDACRAKAGLDDAISLLTALADGPSRTAGFEKAVYVIRVAGDPISKIGVSANPSKRLMDLQAAHYRELELHAVIFCPKRKSVSIEQAVLQRANQAGNRLMGEWIADEPDNVLRAALECARDGKHQICDGASWFRNMALRARELHRLNKDRQVNHLRQRDRRMRANY